MKIPPIVGIGLCRVQKNMHLKSSPKYSPQNSPLFSSQVSSDTVSFTSVAQYVKKYATLPDEIKEVLSVKDAIDMFQYMEYVADGLIKSEKIGKGNSSDVYESPWLKDYYFVVLTNGDVKSQVIYSKVDIGDAVWQDIDNSKIQLLHASS